MAIKGNSSTFAVWPDTTGCYNFMEITRFIFMYFIMYKFISLCQLNVGLLLFYDHNAGLLIWIAIKTRLMKLKCCENPPKVCKSWNYTCDIIWQLFYTFDFLQPFYNFFTTFDNILTTFLYLFDNFWQLLIIFNNFRQL